MEKCKVSFDGLQWESPLKGARQKAVQEGKRRLRLVEFSRGFVEPDWCLKGHIGYVLEGEMDVNFDGTLVHYSAGDGILIPPGPANKHKATISTEVVRLFLVEDILLPSLTQSTSSRSRGD
jgi:quercetin dioxygenase-like cupin family protein